MEEIDKKLELFKTQILLEIKNSENNIAITQNEVYNEIDKKFNTITSLLSLNSENIHDIQDFNSIVKLKIIDKYTGLTEFSKHAKDELINLDLRLNSIQKELYKAISKYDRINSENLFVPGLIGDSCKFSNLREYIERNIINITEFQKDKEKNTIEHEHMKNQIISTIKQINIQLESTEKINKEFLNDSFKTCENKLKKDFYTYSQQLSDVKIENGKYHLEAMNRVKELKGDIDRFNMLKEDFLVELNRIKSYQTTNYNNVLEDIKSINTNLESLKGATKVCNYIYLILFIIIQYLTICDCIIFLYRIQAHLKMIYERISSY